MTRFRTAVLYIGAIAVTVPTLISGCANSGTPSVNAAAQTSQPPVAVQSTHPSLRDIARVISLPGEATAWQEATLYAKVPGYVESIIVDKGDRVRAGQVVATLRAPELEADRQQAHLSSLSAEEAARVSEAMERKSDAEVARAKAAVDRAGVDYLQAPAALSKARAQLTQAESVEKRSEEQRVLAESSVDESRTQFQKAQADLDAAQSEQKLANITLERYRGIYTKDNRLIARQQVDEAQSRADVASEKVNAAEGQLQAARARVKSAESQVRVAQHQIEEAKAGITAARDQVSVATAQQASARKQVDLAKTDVAISRSQGLVNQAQASQARLQAAVQRSAESRTGTLAAYATIRAPFSGIVTKRLADVGAFIQTAATSQNAAAVATVADIDRIRIYYHVPEQEAGFIRSGTPVQLTSSSNPDDPLKAKVSRTSGSLDPKSRTLLAEIDLPNKSGLLLPGAYFFGKIELEHHPNVISIPSTAVGVEKAGKFVFVVAGGKAKRVPVTTGFDNGAFTEITDGLKGDKEVVVTGRDNLTAGAPVTTTAWVPKKKPAKK